MPDDVRSTLDAVPPSRESGGMSTSFPGPQVLVPILVAHLSLTALVWQDIQRRNATQLRGSKTLWRVLTGLNTANSLLYLLIGRR